LTTLVAARAAGLTGAGSELETRAWLVEDAPAPCSQVSEADDKEF
jgi:hypothetical protein